MWRTDIHTYRKWLLNVLSDVKIKCFYLKRKTNNWKYCISGDSSIGKICRWWSNIILYLGWCTKDLWKWYDCGRKQICLLYPKVITISPTRRGLWNGHREWGGASTPPPFINLFRDHFDTIFLHTKGWGRMCWNCHFGAGGA